MYSLPGGSAIGGVIFCNERYIGIIICISCLHLLKLIFAISRMAVLLDFGEKYLWLSTKCTPVIMLLTAVNPISITKSYMTLLY